MDKDEMKSVLGIAYLFTVISAAFSLLARMTAIFSSGNPQEGLWSFLRGDLLWLIIVLCIILILNRLNHDKKQGLADTFNNDSIRKTAAILIIIDGLLKLADSYANFTKYLGTLRNFETNGIGTDGMMGPVAGSVVSLVILVIQILVGIYLLRQYKGGSGNKRA